MTPACSARINPEVRQPLASSLFYIYNYFIIHYQFDFDKHFFKEDLNSRLNNFDSIYNDRTYSKQATTGAREILEIGEGIMRDLFLLSLGQDDLIQHLMLKDKLSAAKAAIDKACGGRSGEYILSKLQLVSEARKYLESNVNPRLVLEQLLINL